MLALVTTATGKVGSRVVRRLLDAGARVRVLVRSPERARGLPPEVEVEIGDLTDGASLGRAFDGVEAVFLATPLIENETEAGLNGVAAAREAEVRRIVCMTAFALEANRHIPHFASKIPVAEAVRKSGIPYTLIEPNNFMQNDLALAAAITGFGVYAQPLGPVGVSRVDARDIADAAVAAMLGTGHENRAYPLVGPEALTGEQVAAAYGRHLGREVRYGGDDVDAWHERVKPYVPLWLANDGRTMYRSFVERGLRASPADLDATRAILGREPRSLDRFIVEEFLPAAKARA